MWERYWLLQNIWLIPGLIAIAAVTGFGVVDAVHYLYIFSKRKYVGNRQNRGLPGA